MAATTRSDRSRPPAEWDITFEDFLALVPDGQKADLLNGVIYVASPDNADANDLSVWLSIVLGSYIEARDLGKLNTSRFAYRLGDKGGPEPDLGFVSKARLGERRRGFPGRARPGD
jgi:Uma2 family endonuclease